MESGYLVDQCIYGNAYRIDVDYENQQNGFYEKNDTRSAALSFSYQLGGIQQLPVKELRPVRRKRNARSKWQ